MLTFAGIALVAVVVFGLFINLTGTSSAITTPMVLRGFLLGLTCGVFTGAIIASIGYPLIEQTYQTIGPWMIPAAILGAFIGGTSGAGIGAVSGFLLGTVTRRFFSPLRDTTRYQWVMLIAGIVSTIGLVILVGWILGGNNIQSSYDPARQARQINLYIVVPAMFGAVLAIPSSLCLVRWYIANSARFAAAPQQSAT